MSSVYIETALKPLNWLNVYSSTTRDTVETRSLEVTVLVQITDREEVVALFGSTVGVQVVLLAIAVVDSLIVPVKVLTVSTDDLGIANQLTVRGKQGVVGLVVDVQIEAVGNQVL